MIRAIAFDFDGVLVESVEVKTRAFARLFNTEGPDAVRKILDYHLENGGVSRFEKFKTIYRSILKRPLSEEQFRSLCERFSELVVDEVVARLPPAEPSGADRQDADQRGGASSQQDGG